MPEIKLGGKIALTIAALGCAVIIGANAHFVYVAAKTQPECVLHKKNAQDALPGFAAAKSSC